MRLISEHSFSRVHVRPGDTINIKFINPLGRVIREYRENIYNSRNINHVKVFEIEKEHGLKDGTIIMVGSELNET